MPEDENGSETTEYPVHRILLVKTKTTGSIQLLVQSSDSLEKCRKHFDEILGKHDITNKKK